MKRLLFALCVVVLSPGLASAQNASIAQRLAAEIRVVLPGASVVVPDPYGLDITFGGQNRSVGIGSVHAACAQGDAACDGAIRDYARSAAAYMLEAAPVMRDQLRIVVRSQAYLDNMTARMGSSLGFVVEHSAGELVNICYRDLPRGRRPILSTDLTALELEPHSALLMCKANSHNLLEPLATLWNPLPQQGIGVIRNGDDVTGYFVTSEDWQPLKEQLGDLIVSVPSVDTLLYARGTDLIDVDALATLTRQMNSQASVPVSTQVFRLTDSGWVVVQPY